MVGTWLRSAEFDSLSRAGGPEAALSLAGVHESVLQRHARALQLSAGRA